MRHVLLAGVLLAAVLAQTGNTNLICPDNDPHNCYPQVFEPTNEWQIVRDDQQIPPGLHVRMNINTGLREARLLQPEGEGDHQESAGNDIVLNEGQVAEVALVESSNLDLDPNEVIDFKTSKVGDGELTDVDSATHEVLGFKNGGDISRLEKALATLVEFSHDIEYGAQLTQDKGIFEALYKAGRLAVDRASVVEKIYNIMGSALRNNPEAVTSFLQKHSASLLPRLLQVVKDPLTSEVVQKRILGVFQALSSNTAYAQQQFDLLDPNPKSHFMQLVSSFPKLGVLAQDRFMTLLEDLNVLQLVQDETTSSAERMLQFLQRLLYQKEASSGCNEELFKVLAALHSSRSLAVNPAFLHWMGSQMEQKRLQARDKPPSEFDEFFVEARHGIFGNPNAGRKFDEL